MPTAFSRPLSTNATVSAGVCAVGVCLALGAQVYRLRYKKCVAEPKLARWLEAQGLARYTAALLRHGYDDLELLAILTEAEIDEFIRVVQPLPGHAAKFRKRLAQSVVGIERVSSFAPSVSGGAANSNDASHTADLAEGCDGGNTNGIAIHSATTLCGHVQQQPCEYSEQPPPTARGSAPLGNSDEEYTISINKQSSSTPLGLEINSRQAGLFVGAVMPCGLVARWNQQHADCQVESGHRILEVDGVRGSPEELMQALQRETISKICFNKKRLTPGAALALAVGSKAVLCGLAAKPELNGRVGTLQSWDEASRRWTFVLQDSGKTVRVRTENMHPLRQETEGGSSSSNAQPSSVRAPEDFRCCITQDIMEQPVITADGHTYERAAITRWLEEHSTSPKTGQELADRVLRPNHALRAQIIRWREQQGLPPLPPWEPEPQEIVQAPQSRAQPAEHAMMAAMVTVQTPTGSFTMSMPNPVQGQQIAINEGTMAHLLVSNPALMEEVMQVAHGDNAGFVPPSAEMSAEALAQQIPLNPRLTEVVMRWIHSEPDAREQLAHLQGGILSGGNASESPIFRAAREGECGVVEQLLGPDVRPGFERDFSLNGDSLLHVASWYGHSRLASMLLARGHSLHLVGRNRSTPLHYAAYMGHADVVRLLLAGRADTERKMMCGDAPLHQAAWQGHAPALKLLLEARASVNAVKDDGDSALMLAAGRGRVEACRELLTVLDVDGRPDGLEHRNHAGLTPLHSAASSGNHDVVTLLLEASASVHIRSNIDEVPLHCAVVSGNLDVASAILAARAEPNVLRLEDEQTPLNLAILEGHPDIVRILVENHACLTAADRRDGMSPTHFAVLREAGPVHRQQERSVIAVLAEMRADVNATTSHHNTPVHVLFNRHMPAAMPNRITALRALVEARADLEAPTRTGHKPLHMAVGTDMRVEAALLLESRADVNADGGVHGSPLHYAAQQGARDCVELMLRARADPTRTNDAGQTPADVARQCGFENIEQLLQARSYE